MARTDLSANLMRDLIDSEAWRHLMAQWLVAEFEAAEEQFDISCDVLAQGFKRALKVVIETPYQVAGVESPLMRKYDGALKSLGRKRRARSQRRRPIPIAVPQRSSGLV